VLWHWDGLLDIFITEIYSSYIMYFLIKLRSSFLRQLFCCMFKLGLGNYRDREETLSCMYQMKISSRLVQALMHSIYYFVSIPCYIQQNSHWWTYLLYSIYADISQINHKMLSISHLVKCTTLRTNTRLCSSQ
jgi:hypothetical protein